MGGRAPRLRIDGLTKTFRDGHTALEDVCLEVGSGLFGLLGPNGAGKTTLMRIVCTLMRPSRGTVEFAGLDSVRDALELRSRIGYLPQEFGVPPRTSARAMLGHLATLKGITGTSDREAHVDELLTRVNLSSAADRELQHFSGGMRRRFGIAQAMLGRPSLLVVDEPTAGLDPHERDELHLLLATAARDAIVVLSTHLVDDVAGLCPQVAILHGRRIDALGSPGGLASSLDGRVWERHQSEPGTTDLRDQARMLSRRATRSGYRVRVVAEGRPGENFEPTEPTLEDFYFHRVGRPA